MSEHRQTTLRALFVFSLLALDQVAVPSIACGQDSIPGLTVSTRRPDWPILIGNQDGPLLRVVLEVGKVAASDVFPRNDVRLISLSFSLAGSDDPGDLQSLRLLSTGNDEEMRLSRRQAMA